MPGKKKEALKQAKYEAWEEGRRRDRMAMEEEEYQARKHLEQGEELGSAQIRLQRFEEYTDPEAGLSYSQNEHMEVQARVKEREDSLLADLTEAKQELTHVRSANDMLEAQLRDVRTDTRQLAESVRVKMEKLREEMLAAIDMAMAKTMSDIEAERVEADALFNGNMEKTRQRFLELVDTLRHRSEYFTDLLLEAKHTHSNLPARIRRHLKDMECSELLMILDTLSFEPEVLQYFMFKFPPEVDCPYGSIAEIMKAQPRTRSPQKAALQMALSDRFT
eukprot:TRINITY_DN9957_c0_g1_i2.p2 TRINITY_DN9957_c0_g1~~TRINITY_DN9957_c0_g1_i2.p2  ORF type:complete len:277 (+),score=101.33 TRINITY_DN9957_c0_g1_i2:1760-2590(+)